MRHGLVPQRSTLHRLLVLSVGLVAACRGERASAPPPPEPLDLRGVLGEMVLPGINVVSLALPASTSVSASVAPAIDPSRCSYSASTGGFDCPAVTVGGLTVTQSYLLFDAAGKPQSRADRNTTASVRALSTMTGTLSFASGASTPGGTLTVNRRQDMTLSGLLTGRHVLNGTANMMATGTLTVGSSSQPVTLTEQETTAELVLPAATPGDTTQHWPRSGSITVDATVGLGGGSPPAFSTAFRQQMTFNGTSTIAIVTTTAAGTKSCTVDLATKAPPVCP